MPRYAPSRFKKLKSTWPTFGWKGNQSIWNNRRPWLTQLQTTDRFGYTLWGCEMGIRFPAIKLLNFAARWEELEASDNPFAVAVMAHLKARETKEDAIERQRWKFALIRRLYEKRYDRKKITDLFCFIDWLMQLPEELEHLFWQELEQYEEEKSMPYVTSVERIGIKKGQAAWLLRLLVRKFGAEVNEGVRKRIAAADTSRLEEWGERILTATSLTEVFGEV